MNKSIISQEKIAAMKAKDMFRSTTLTSILAAIKQHEVDNRTVVDDTTLITILNKMVKQRQDSITQFTSGNRLDLVEIEQKELSIIREFLPQAASQEEVDIVIAEAISSVGNSAKSMGTIMKIIREKLNGRTDMAAVSQSVKDKLL